MLNITQLPSELSQGREATEANFIFCLYKDPSLIEEYRDIKTDIDIITDDGRFFYDLARRLRTRGYNSFDRLTIYEYLGDKEALRAEYDIRGGYEYIGQAIAYLDTENIDTYYSQLKRSNMMILLYEQKYPVLQYLDKLEDMDATQIWDFFDYKLANIALGNIDKIAPKNLSEGYADFISAWDSGRDTGFVVSNQKAMLNKRLLGVHKKNLMLHCAGIGSGKTTSAIAWYIIPNLEQGNNVCVIANEQDEDAWRKMLLSTVMFTKFGTEDTLLTRQKISLGRFSDTDKEKMLAAERWLATRPGQLTYVDLPTYDINSVKKVVKTQARKGTSLFLFDTMKSMDDSASNSWGIFSEMAKELFQLTKTTDVAMIATCQLSPDAMSRRYLDLTCVGRARQISEVANSVVMFRHMTRDEKRKIKNDDIYVYDEKTGIRIPKTLDIEKDYIMVFTPKNRYGKTDPQIIMEANMDYNIYTDIGYYECPYDTFNNR